MRFEKDFRDICFYLSGGKEVDSKIGLFVLKKNRGYSTQKIILALVSGLLITSMAGPARTEVNYQVNGWSLQSWFIDESGD